MSKERTIGGIPLNFLNKWFSWKEDDEQKRLEKWRERGACPACSGRGFNPMILNEFMYLGAYDDYKCFSCNGSGRWEDWEQADH